MKKAFFALFAVGTLILGGCPKPTPPPPVVVPPTYDNSFTIDGGRFKKTVINFKNVTLSTGGYTSANKLTTVNLEATTGDTVSVGFDMNFLGAKTGSFPYDGINNFIHFTLTTPSLTNGNDFNVISGSGSIVATRYETVGGKIGGTFGGRFNGPDGVTYSVSNGTFLVVRAADK
jgi:hypothetical protein